MNRTTMLLMVVVQIINVIKRENKMNAKNKMNNRRMPTLEEQAKMREHVMAMSKDDLITLSAKIYVQGKESTEIADQLWCDAGILETNVSKVLH